MSTQARSDLLATRVGALAAVGGSVLLVASLVLRAPPPLDGLTMTGGALLIVCLVALLTASFRVRGVTAYLVAVPVLLAVALVVFAAVDFSITGGLADIAFLGVGLSVLVVMAPIVAARSAYLSVLPGDAAIVLAVGTIALVAIPAFAGRDAVTAASVGYFASWGWVGIRMARDGPTRSSADLGSAPQSPSNPTPGGWAN